MLYYPVLERMLDRRGIKKKALARELRICSQTLNNKLSGHVPFTLPEAQAIHAVFFPDIGLEVLFAQAGAIRNAD